MKEFDLSDLDLSNIGSWPMAAKAAIVVVICIAVLAAGYFFDVQSQQQILAKREKHEIKLKKAFERKQARASNLEAYKQQMLEMKESFGAMLRQLPSRTEVDDLLIDISQAGLASGIEFELFKPAKEKHRDFYAVLPISIKVKGTYHEFADFISAVAALPRIVTLHNISIGPIKKSAKLSMRITAKTYRYLDENELAAKTKKKRKKKRRRR